MSPRGRSRIFTPPDPFVLIVVALTLVGIGFIAGRGTADGDGIPEVPLDAAMAVGPRELPGDRLDPDFRDQVIVTLQWAFDSLSREVSAARLRPPVRPCRVDDDCPIDVGGAP